MPYCFLGSSIKYQGHTGWKIDDLNPVWVRLLGRSQLSNPSDLPCYCCNLNAIDRLLYLNYWFMIPGVIKECKWSNAIIWNSQQGLINRLAVCGINSSSRIKRHQRPNLYLMNRSVKTIDASFRALQYICHATEDLAARLPIKVI